MENKNFSYLKTDESIIINEKHIRWVKKINDCMEVCTKSNGCVIGNTHKICKLNNENSYNILNKNFE